MSTRHGDAEFAAEATGVTPDDCEIVVIGGGPAGATAASVLAQSGRKVVVFEHAVHPRAHVGESLTPSCNIVLDRIGVLDDVEQAGFVHKPGAGWTAPQSPIGRFVSLRLAEVPMPGAPRPYAFNVERDEFDAILLGHASRSGANVQQGATVRRVIFEGNRAAGVTVQTSDGAQRDVRCRFVIDASGRRCVLGSQLDLKRIDPGFHQVAVYSWFENVTPHPCGTEGMLFLHFLGLERAWAWQIPLRHGISSVGLVTDRRDFSRAGGPHEFFASLAKRNSNLSYAIQAARPVRPFVTEGDYSYSIDRLAGPGWMVVGDALRFVDPVFSTGVDVALFSALSAGESVDAVLRGGDEGAVFGAFERTMTEGVAVWYELIKLFYGLQNLFTFFVMKRATRARVIRLLQGNPYLPEAQREAREVIELIRSAHDRVGAGAGNLLRPWALDPGSASARRND